MVWPPSTSLNSVLWLLLLVFVVVLESWNPEDEHPCTLPRYSPDAFDSAFGAQGGLPPLYPTPIVVHRGSINKAFRKRTEREALLQYFGDNFSVTLSSSNAYSQHRRTVSLRQYLDESLEAEETAPDAMSNETWYLFGETYSDEWKVFLDDYELPHCRVCSKTSRANGSLNVALSFGIGNRGSGVQWHVHGPGFSEALHGRKHWVLYPPSPPASSEVSFLPSQASTSHPVSGFDKDKSSRQWMESVYPNVTVKPQECTLDPGDAIYFPNQWWHATINLDPYTAFISTFTTEHKVDEDLLKIEL